MEQENDKEFLIGGSSNRSFQGADLSVTSGIHKTITDWRILTLYFYIWHYLSLMSFSRRHAPDHWKKYWFLIHNWRWTGSVEQPINFDYF